MSTLVGRLNKKKERDLKVLGDFVSIYCREKHRSDEKDAFAVKDERLQQALGDKRLHLCADCIRLLHHSTAKLLLCKQDPKPMCKKCKIHCYAPGYREKIRDVMKFSGLYLVRHGRLDLMVHYFV
ncbi:MAG: hypothetical protein A2147_06600 [Chloroflexi bacterium RBG_16_57_8]|nr:MAG: hypothetical protein A2147_06600 [Chloroflexi bacterium RBG_16_57_8]